MNDPAADQPQRKAMPASPEAYRIIGAFSAPDDAALMDEVMKLVMQERKHRNAQLPLDFDLEPQP